MNRETPLNVGDRCWWIDSQLLEVVEIREVRKVLEGDPDEFLMYRITRHPSSSQWNDSVSRLKLFKLPEEKKKLLEELDDTERRFKQYHEDVENQESWELGLV